MLSQCGTGLGMLGLAGILADQGSLRADPPAGNGGSDNPLSPKAPHYPARAKRIIHLYMNGGPSQVDTFDPKPALARFQGQRRPASPTCARKITPAAWHRRRFVFRCGQSGLPISEIFPELAKCADDLCIIRSMHTNVPNHEPSMFMMNSGHVQSVRPSYGSWLLYGLGTENQNLPGYVVLGPNHPVNGAANWSNRFLPGIYQGTHLDLRPNYEPERVIAHLANTQLSQEEQRRQLNLIQSMNRRQIERRGSDPLLEARIESFEMAFRMQTAAPEAFDLHTEPESIRQLYGLGTRPGGEGNIFAQNCLLARRLVERGVRVVQVYFGTFQPWDTHDNNANQHRNHANASDRPIAALLTDLKQRGLLEDTLVLWGGEFMSQ